MVETRENIEIRYENICMCIVHLGPMIQIQMQRQHATVLSLMQSVGNASSRTSATLWRICSEIPITHHKESHIHQSLSRR